MDRPAGKSFDTGMKSLAVRVLGDFGVDGVPPHTLGSRKAGWPCICSRWAAGRPCRPAC
jgi:hypothetical protein